MFVAGFLSLGRAGFLSLFGVGEGGSWLGVAMAARVMTGVGLMASDGAANGNAEANGDGGPTICIHERVSCGAGIGGVARRFAASVAEDEATKMARDRGRMACDTLVMHAR
jgi:hypothetical protein